MVTELNLNFSQCLSLGILPFEFINKLQIGVSVYKLKSNQPMNFTNCLRKNSKIHSHYTRSIGNLPSTLFAHQNGARNIGIRGPSVWNSLPIELIYWSTHMISIYHKLRAAL